MILKTKLKQYIEWQSDLNVVLSILGITFIAYSNIFFGHEFLTYDDNWYIYENKNVINLSWESIVNMFSSLKKGQYSPIGELYHSIIYYFFGKNAIAFKFFALLTHLINAALVFKLFRYLTNDRWSIIFITLVFALHPMQVETIGWISAIYRIAATFMLLGFIFYCKYLNSDYKGKYIILFTLFYILGLFTKEQAILFPLGILLINFKKDLLVYNSRIIKENILFGVLTLAFGLITIEITKTGGPSIVDRDVHLFEKFALLFKAGIDYTYNFLFPYKLSFSYPYTDDIKVNQEISLIRIVLITPFIFLAFKYLKNKTILFGVLWAIGFMALALFFAFFHLRDSFMADRYIYIAIIGFSYTLYSALKILNEKVLKNGLVPVSISAFFVISFIFLTVSRVPVFKNSKTLWTNALAVNEQNPYAFNSLGYYYRNNNQLDLALKHYTKSLEIFPDYYLGHSNIGKVYFEQKKYELALKHINLAIKIYPNYERGYINRVAVNTILRNYDFVLRDLKHLSELNPSNPDYLTEQAKIYFKLKNYGKCIELIDEIIALDQDNYYANYLGGHSAFMLKKYNDAENYLNEAIRLNEKMGVYYFIRSVTALHLGKPKKAFADALRAKENGHNVSPGYLKQLVQTLKK